jgi:hypothetical protein
MKITLLVIAALSLAGAAKADPTTPEQQQRPNEKPLWDLIQKKDREKPIRACWHPGLARNIGIAEQSCDALTGPSSPAPSIERLPLPPRPKVQPPNDCKPPFKCGTPREPEMS